jgi:hypothetical protein
LFWCVSACLHFFSAFEAAKPHRLPGIDIARLWRQRGVVTVDDAGVEDC